jgi:hypothetical protein
MLRVGLRACLLGQNNTSGGCLKYHRAPRVAFQHRNSCFPSEALLLSASSGRQLVEVCCAATHNTMYVRVCAAFPPLCSQCQLPPACTTTWPHGLLSSAAKKFDPVEWSGKAFESRRRNAMPEIKLYEPPQLLVDWNRLGSGDRRCEMRPHAHTRPQRHIIMQALTAARMSWSETFTDLFYAYEFKHR